MAAMLKLNTDQAEIVRFVEDGHNVLITGQAGAGKSEVVKAIIKRLRAAGRKLGVVCSTGIATQVFDKGTASTVNSYYGFGTAELSWSKLIERSLDNNIVTGRIKDIETIVWDEASMSSKRMLELVNAIHNRLSTADTHQNPFAGKQLILVGEFLQLRPVPSCLDEGSFMFLSPVFGAAITHRFELKEIMRQAPNDLPFLSCLREIRLGECSDTTEKYLTSLSRPLVGEKKVNEATHIFFKKIPALLYNRKMIETLPGEMFTFQAISNNGEGMHWPGQNVLHLKSGCRVMLIWNKTESLKNGTIGVFHGVENELLRVEFEGVGAVLIGRETWVRRNRHGESVGTMSQYPLVLAYGVTCHKSQGLTLSSEVVHCSQEFVPGLIYVAISRVKEADNLQVLNFRKGQLLKPPQNVIDSCSTQHTCHPVEDLSCCRKKILSEELFRVSDRFSEECEEEESFSFPLEMMDGPVQACFENDSIPLEMNELFLKIEKCESELCTPTPEEMRAIPEVVASLKVRETSEFAAEENKLVDFLLSSGERKRLEAYWKLIWFHVFLIFSKHVYENAGEVENLVVDISTKSFTDATSKLGQFWSTEDFSKYVSGLFETTVFTECQRAVAVKIGMKIYTNFLKNVAFVVRREQADDTLQLSVEEMSAVGKAKVRYVGGWAIRKVLEKLRSFIKRNISSSNSHTLDKVNERHLMCELLEENIIVPYSRLQETTNHEETLEITEERQFRERGLIHISDDAYLFFMKLEAARVRLLNDGALKKEKENMILTAKTKLEEDVELKAIWLACFRREDRDSNEDQIGALLQDVLFHYINMGAAQYLRDFRRQCDLKKSAQLRQRVLQKQQKSKERNDSVPFKDILKDRSPGKHVSHARLLQFIQQHKDLNSLCRVYTKQQLVALCEAYNIKVLTKWNKKVLAQHLSTAVVQGITSIPLIIPVDDRKFNVTSIDCDYTQGSVRMTLRRE